MPFNTESFTKNLTEKLGPLPGYAWVLIGVGGVYWYRKSHPSTAAVTASTAAAPGSSSTTLAVDPNAVLPSDNANWAAQAASNLYASSAHSPDQISSALSNYLNGSTLSASDQAIISAAIAGLGNTPQTINPSIPPTTLDPYVDITPGYTNPPGFTGPAAIDGPSGTALTTKTTPVTSAPAAPIGRTSNPLGGSYDTSNNNSSPTKLPARVS